MNAKMVLNSVVIVGVALVAGGCQLINPKNPVVSNSTPTASPSASPSIFTPLPTAEPTPIATTSAKPAVKGITTATPKKGTVTTVRSGASSLYDTDFDSWEVTNFPGQNFEKQLTLYNRTSQKVMFSVRAADRFSGNAPVSVNGSFEATGSIEPQSYTSVKLVAYSSDATPSFSTVLNINFVNLNNQIISSRTVKVTAHTPIGDRTNIDSNTDANSSGNATMNVVYAANRAYPIRINNKHSYKVNWSARFTNNPNNGLVLSATAGTIEVGGFWDTDIHFTSKDIGSMNQATLEITFTRDNSDTKDIKTVTVNVSR